MPKRLVHGVKGSPRHWDVDWVMKAVPPLILAGTWWTWAHSPAHLLKREISATNLACVTSSLELYPSAMMTIGCRIGQGRPDQRGADVFGTTASRL